MSVSRLFKKEQQNGFCFKKIKIFNMKNWHCLWSSSGKCDRIYILSCCLVCEEKPYCFLSHLPKVFATLFRWALGSSFLWLVACCFTANTYKKSECIQNKVFAKNWTLYLIQFLGMIKEHFNLDSFKTKGILITTKKKLANVFNTIQDISTILIDALCLLSLHTQGIVWKSSNCVLISIVLIWRLLEFFYSQTKTVALGWECFIERIS